MLWEEDRAAATARREAELEMGVVRGGQFAAGGGFADPDGAGARAGARQPGGRLVLLELAEAQEACQ